MRAKWLEYKSRFSRRKIGFSSSVRGGDLGIDGRIIDVEMDVSPGLLGFELIGRPDTSEKESKERVRTAIRSCGRRG